MSSLCTKLHRGCETPPHYSRGICEDRLSSNTKVPLQKFNAWTKKKAMAKKQQQRIFRRGGNPYAATLVTAKGRSATSGSVGRAASSSAASSSTILPRLVVCLVETKLSPDDCCGRGVVIKPRSVRGIASADIIVVPSFHWLLSESAERNAWVAILVVGLGK